MKLISRFAPALLMLIAFGCANSTSAQFVRIEADAIDNGGAVPGTTYRVYALMENEGDLIDAVFGDGKDVLIVESTKPFYQSDLGGDLAKDTQRSLAESNDELKYDSWVTIGFADNYMNALTGFMIDFSEFATGGRIFSDNGAWFVTPDMLQARAGKDGRILLMQLTTEGVVSGVLNIHGRTRSTGKPGEEVFDLIEERQVAFSFGGE
jgi:hypothetical protein|tara:strand:+ start:548 stop:1171 length:624 start_codon:yes stop_codon:yes gene_type:complete